MTQPIELPQPDRWWQYLIRLAIFSLARLFYPRIRVRGVANLPSGGPVIFVLNHPNGLMDPLVLMLALQRPVSFLAKSTLFGNPLGKTFLNAFAALPVYRHQDEGKPGGPRGDAREHNEQTFAICRALLRAERAMALFPEGTTHSGSQLLPLRSGAARIALSAEQEAGWSLGLQIVPVGLWYERKTDFRSSILVVIGRPFTLEQYAAKYESDKRETVEELTGRIDAGLDEVVLQAENAELLAAIPVLAAWTAPTGTPTLAEQHAWTTQLLAAYERLRRTDPARLESIAEQAYQYAGVLQLLGIADPWALELAPPQLKSLQQLIIRLVISSPAALIGFILSYIPYRLAGPIAILLVGQYDTQISTFKLIGGSILVGLGWILEALLIGLWGGLTWSVLLLIVAPPAAYVALRWGEDWFQLRRLLAARWLRWRRGKLVDTLVEQRQTLAREVMAAVQVASEEGPAL